jgi:hypothetical protein
MQAIAKVEIQERRDELELKVHIHNGNLDLRKVREIVQNAEIKLNMSQCRIKTGMLQQEHDLEARI